MWLYFCSADLLQVCFLVAQLGTAHPIKSYDITGAGAFKSKSCRVVFIRCCRDNRITDNTVAIGSSKELKGVVIDPHCPTVDGVKTDLTSRPTTTHNRMVNRLEQITGDNYTLTVCHRNTHTFPVADKLAIGDRSRAIDKLDASIVGVKIATVNGDLSPAKVGTVDAPDALVRNVVANEDIPGRNTSAGAVDLDTIVRAGTFAVINKNISNIIAVVNDKLGTVARQAAHAADAVIKSDRCVAGNTRHTARRLIQHERTVSLRTTIETVVHNIGYLYIDRIFIVADTTATNAMKTVEKDSPAPYYLGKLPYTLDGRA